MDTRTQRVRSDQLRIQGSDLQVKVLADTRKEGWKLVRFLHMNVNVQRAYEAVFELDRIDGVLSLQREARLCRMNQAV